MLDTKEAVKKFAETMTYDKRHPTVNIIGEQYETGAKVNKGFMEIYEKALERVEGLKKWFIRIYPKKAMDELAFTDCFY